MNRKCPVSMLEYKQNTGLESLKHSSKMKGAKFSIFVSIFLLLEILKKFNHFMNSKILNLMTF